MLCASVINLLAVATERLKPLACREVSIRPSSWKYVNSVLEQDVKFMYISLIACSYFGLADAARPFSFKSSERSCMLSMISIV